MFKDDYWLASPDGLRGAFEYLKFSTLYVNFDEACPYVLRDYPVKQIGLDRDLLNLLVRPLIASLAKTAVGGIRHHMCKSGFTRRNRSRQHPVDVDSRRRRIFP